MAITLEEEKKPVNWLNVTAIILILTGILFSGYYLFFKKPELIEVVAAGKYQDIAKLSKLKVDPQDLIASPQFKLLKQFGSEINPPTPGKRNPFRPFQPTQ